VVSLPAGDPAVPAAHPGGARGSPESAVSMPRMAPSTCMRCCCAPQVGLAQPLDLGREGRHELLLRTRQPHPELRTGISACFSATSPCASSMLRDMPSTVFSANRPRNGPEASTRQVQRKSVRREGWVMVPPRRLLAGSKVRCDELPFLEDADTVLCDADTVPCQRHHILLCQHHAVLLSRTTVSRVITGAVPDLGWR